MAGPEHTAERARQARKWATWGLKMYGQVIPVDCDEGRPRWVTVIPLCPNCLKPISTSNEMWQQMGSSRSFILIGCGHCGTEIGPLLPREEAYTDDT